MIDVYSGDMVRQTREKKDQNDKTQRAVARFNPASASVHLGTYTTVLAAMTGSVLALAYIVGGVQILQSILIYGVFVRDSSGNAAVEGAVHLGIMAAVFPDVFFCPGTR